jgi:hypothetical protein
MDDALGRSADAEELRSLIAKGSAISGGGRKGKNS